MSNILDELTIKFDRYNKYTQKEQQNIINLLKMIFDDGEHEHDPNLFDQTYVLCFYYKTHLVGCICAMDNFDMQKNMSDFVQRRDSMHIDYGRKGCFIYNLAVIKVMRKKGLGESLLKVLQHYLGRITDYFHVQIKVGNIGSERIFEKMGFKEYKKLNNGYYDFNIYTKNIKNEK